MLADADAWVTMNRRAGEVVITFGGETNQAAQFARSVPGFRFQRIFGSYSFTFLRNFGAYRSSHDSSLEGDGFELLVPRHEKPVAQFPC
jgi:hypothetical protein